MQKDMQNKEENITISFQEEEMNEMLDLFNICKKNDIECRILVVE